MGEIKQWQNHIGDVLDNANGFDVIECQTCGFKHIVPIPSQKELEVVYRSEYYETEKPLYLDRHREDLDWWNSTYSEQYDILEKYLPPDRRRILDVGCGPGFFLAHGEQRGWECLGIEPSAKAAAHCRNLGLIILEDFLTEENAGQLGAFDVVHANNVLEHLPNPQEMVELARDLLSPEGLFYVVVPNDYNPFQRALRTACGYKPWWVAPPHHINYFNFDSIDRLLTSSGFEVILRNTTFPIDMFLLMGDNYIRNDSLGRICHAKRKTLEKNLLKAGMTNFKRNLYQAFESVDIGREVQIVARKKQTNL